jgi:amidohydrolase
MNRIKATRRELHKIPETAFNEYKTHAYIKRTLEEIGFQPYTLLETDNIVFIDRGSKETIAFRSDIDGLPQNELTNHDFKSTIQGNMHACGHDGHMTMLLEFASYLKEHEQDLNVNVMLIFQPAEESIGGAKKLIEAGLFESHPVNKVFGIHVYPEIPEGIITSRPGFLMAQANEVTIEIHGKSAHGAMPHLGIDANHIASLWLTRVYEQTKTIQKDSQVILTFGKITGGTVKNIISEKTILEGTMRTYTFESFKRLSLMMQQTAEQLENQFKCDIDITVHDGYLPVYNDETLYNEFKSIMKDFDYQELDAPLLIAEDFSFYQKEAPGIFFFIGVRNEEKGYTHSLHSSYFDFDEEALKTGIKAYIAILNHFN